MLYLFDGYNILHAGNFRDRRELVDRACDFVALPRGARRGRLRRRGGGRRLRRARGSLRPARRLADRAPRRRAPLQRGGLGHLLGPCRPRHRRAGDAPALVAGVPARARRERSGPHRPPGRGARRSRTRSTPRRRRASIVFAAGVDLSGAACYARDLKLRVRVSGRCCGGLPRERPVQEESRAPPSARSRPHRPGAKPAGARGPPARHPRPQRRRGRAWMRSSAATPASSA